MYPGDPDCNGRCFLMEQMGHPHEHGPDRRDVEALAVALAVRALAVEETDGPPTPELRALLRPSEADASPSGIAAEVFRPPRTG